MGSFKSGFVAVAGRTNVGKSTLLNTMMEQKLSIVTSRPQTTRDIIRLIRTTDTSQMVFIDAPGFHKPRTKLNEYMDASAESTLKDADVILFVVEEDEYIGPGDKRILEMLSGSSVPVILAINKIDRFPIENVLKTIDLYKDYPFINEIVPVSAKKGTNVDTLIGIIEKYLPEGEKYYPDDMVTDRNVRFYIGEIIREKLFEALAEEIPHGIAVSVEEVDEGETVTNISAMIYCDKKSHKAIVIGKNGEKLKRVGTFARRDIEKLLETKVNLKVWVKVREDWTDDPNEMKKFGYLAEEDES
ncbi:MAG: GTPase Era [Eubacteriaceae bacterium]|nr:GTPase Era [Eubacteriaceae bacterium]